VQWHNATCLGVPDTWYRIAPQWHWPEWAIASLLS